MKRHCRDIKKVIWIKWRLTFTKGVTRRSHSLKKHHSNGPKEAPKSLEYIDNLSEEEQKSKKTMEKRLLQSQKKS